MGAIDTVMVSSVGEYAVAGVNIIDNINNLLILGFGALCTGGAVVVSQYIGRRDSENASLASRQLYYVTAGISLVITVFAITARPLLIRLIYGVIADDVMEAAMIYFLVTALSFPFLGVYNACAALFRAVGNSKITMRIALLVNIINVAGNAFFIFGLGIGVLGAALSTLISRIVAASILSFILIRTRRYPITLAGIHKIRIVRSMVHNILNIGIPSGVENSMFMIGRLLSQRIFTYFGTSAMAGNAIASVINSFSFMPGQAFGMTLLTVVGQCVGARDYAGARTYAKKILFLSCCSIGIISLSIFVFMEPLVSLFSLTPEAHEMAKSFLRVHCVFMALGWTMSFALPNALRAAGDARYVMIIAVISMWTVRVCFSYVLTFVFKIGPLGVWFAMGSDFIFRGSCYLTRWLGGRWQFKKVISDN